MRQCQRRLRDQHGVSPNRFRDADSQLHPSRTGGQRVQQRLVLEKGVRARNPPGGSGEVPIPQGGGGEILETIADEQGIQAVQPGHRVSIRMSLMGRLGGAYMPVAILGCAITSSPSGLSLYG